MLISNTAAMIALFISGEKGGKNNIASLLHCFIATCDPNTPGRIDTMLLCFWKKCFNGGGQGGRPVSVMQEAPE